MKKINVLFLLFLIGLCCIQGLSSQKIVKILAIGNSFSQDAAESYVDDLAKADGIQLIIANMYIGGCSLERHWLNAQTDSAAYSYRKIVNGDTTVIAKQKLITAIQDENWDYITLQQVSHSSGLFDTHFPYLSNLVTYVKQHATNPKMQIVFHQTWAYAADSKHKGFKNYNNDQMQMYQAIVNTVKEAGKKAGIKLVIPAGTAIQNGRTSFAGDTFCRDGYHLSLGLGRFTAACTWYEYLLKRPVMKNTFIPAGVTPEEALVAKKAAHRAVKKPYKVSSMTSSTASTLPLP
ncbi:MAG: DUF4886 domain-containing protein [Paludibacter sp.]|nr:DUF4886 domain-containing protein [Paludibacter sp.]MDD4199480.1 DUF4886 domain-containing protein [Paludibacter sp.]MDD4427934.1 DUF4886 domain-containing protein [Paludibacter sp.]